MINLRERVRILEKAVVWMECSYCRKAEEQSKRIQ